MTFRTFAVIFLSVVAIGTAAVSTNQTEAAAKKAAQEWLALVDAGRFADSWDAAGPYMQKAFPREQWERKLTIARKPLGELVSRELNHATPGKDHSGIPGGDYFKLQFRTAFSKKAQATETVTAVLQKDGTWKVSGYYIN